MKCLNRYLLLLVCTISLSLLASCGGNLVDTSDEVAAEAAAANQIKALSVLTNAQSPTIEVSLPPLPIEATPPVSSGLLRTNEPVRLQFSPFSSNNVFSSSSSGSDNWSKNTDVAQYKGASWAGFVKRQFVANVDEAKTIANADSSITYFFYMKGPSMYLETTNVSDKTDSTFSSGEAVFFSGTPWFGSAPGFADSYVKTSTDRREFARAGDFKLADLPGNKCSTSDHPTQNITFSNTRYNWTGAEFFTSSSYKCLYKKEESPLYLRSFFDDIDDGNYKSVTNISNYNVNKTFIIAASDGASLNARINWINTEFIQHIHMEKTPNASGAQVTLKTKKNADGNPNGRGYWISDVEILNDVPKYNGYHDGVAWMDFTFENFDMDLSINYNPALAPSMGSYTLKINADLKFGVPWYNYDRGNAQNELQKLIVDGKVSAEQTGTVASVLAADGGSSTIQVPIGCVPISKSGRSLGCSICLEVGKNIEIKCP